MGLTSTIGAATLAKMVRGDADWLLASSVYDFYAKLDPDPVPPAELVRLIQHDPEAFDTRLVPNPDRSGVSEIPVVSKASIRQFVAKRKRQGEKKMSKKIEDTLSVVEAHALFCEKIRAKGNTPISISVFHHAVSYGIIPSRREGRHLRLLPSDVENFAETYPEGNLHKRDLHKMYPDAMRISEAYEYLKTLDSAPMQFSSFKVLTSNSIIPGVRLPGENTVYVRRRAIEEFAQLRETLRAQSTRFRPTHSTKKKKASSKKGKKTSSKTSLVNSHHKHAQAKKDPSGNSHHKHAQAKKGPPSVGFTLTVTEAYELYRSRVKSPMSQTWFRKQIVAGKLSAAQVRSGKGVKSTWLIDKAAVEKFAEDHRNQTPRRTYFSMRQGYRYGRQHGIVPSTMKYHQFRELVERGSIPHEMSKGKMLLWRQGMESYFSNSQTPVRSPAPVPIQAPAAPSLKPSKVPDNLEILTPEEVANLLRVRVADVLDAYESGDLPGTLIGQQVRFLRAAVLQMLSPA